MGQCSGRTGVTRKQRHKVRKRMKKKIGWLETEIFMMESREKAIDMPRTRALLVILNPRLWRDRGRTTPPQLHHPKKHCKVGYPTLDWQCYVLGRAYQEDLASLKRVVWAELNISSRLPIPNTQEGSDEVRETFLTKYREKVIRRKKLSSRKSWEEDMEDILEINLPAKWSSI